MRKQQEPIFLLNRGRKKWQESADKQTYSMDDLDMIPRDGLDSGVASVTLLGVESIAQVNSSSVGSNLHLGLFLLVSKKRVARSERGMQCGRKQLVISLQYENITTNHVVQRHKQRPGG
jgi:hypothetical protein